MANWLHFAGVGGSGMSALAQFHVLGGGRATGSDRDFDRGGRAGIRSRLEALGVEIRPQDGTGFDASCDGVVCSTAVEDTVPDVRAAREMDVPILHRSELLARYVADHRTLAVTGTSGKSTVVAMIFEILRGAGRDPSLLTGGNLRLLEEQGLLGNAWQGEDDLLVIEADESDGSLVRYEPWCGVVLNLQRDHKEPEEVLGMFETFRERTMGPFLAAAEANLAFSGGEVSRFGLDDAAGIKLDRDGSRFRVGDAFFVLPIPGVHNVQNALAAIAACRSAGVGFAEMVEPLASFRGVARRFQTMGRAAGVEVIDDFAHNPAKIAATLRAARPRCDRVLAFFQPHGYGPTRFMREDLIETFASGLRSRDRLYMPEIYYAGGTVTRDISSRDIIDAVRERGVTAEFAESRRDLIPCIAADAEPGDSVLVMGARDPSLSDFCREILSSLSRKPG